MSNVDISPVPSNVVPAREVGSVWTQQYVSPADVVTKIERATLSSHNMLTEVVNIYVAPDGAPVATPPLLWKVHVSGGSDLDLDALEGQCLNPGYALYTRADNGGLVTLNVSGLLFNTPYSDGGGGGGGGKGSGG